MASPACPWLALARQPHLGARFDAVWQFYVDRLAVAERNPLRAQGCRVFEANGQTIGDVGTFGGCAAPERTSPARAGPSTEQAFEDIAEVGAAVLESTTGKASPLSSPAAGETERSRRITVTVDLAPIEARAFVGIGQQVIGRRHF